MEKHIDADLIKSTQSLYSDIDSCIDELLKARTEHKQENEGKALFNMEGLMVATLQQLDCIIDSLQQEQQDFPTTDEEVEKFLATHPKVEVPDKYKMPDWLFKKQEQPEADLEDKVTFDCISKKVTMTVRELINYYIDRECCDVADECGF